MTLEQAVQRGTRQMGHRRLQRVETVIQRQQGVFVKGDAKRLLIRRQHR